jgi:hypothetical protein
VNLANREYMAVFGAKQCTVLVFDVKSKTASRVSVELSLDALQASYGGVSLPFRFHLFPILLLAFAFGQACSSPWSGCEVLARHLVVSWACTIASVRPIPVVVSCRSVQTPLNLLKVEWMPGSQTQLVVTTNKFIKVCLSVCLSGVLFDSLSFIAFAVITACLLVRSVCCVALSSLACLRWACLPRTVSELKLTLIVPPSFCRVFSFGNSQVYDLAKDSYSPLHSWGVPKVSPLCLGCTRRCDVFCACSDPPALNPCIAFESLCL